MGAVYEGVHQKIDKRLAIKVLDPRLAADERQKARFLREARSATKIRSRHVVDITDFGDEPVAYFAMELLQGSDLADLLRAEGPLPWDRAKRLLLQICSGLHAAHVEGVVHRDIKPSNIFVEQDESGGDFVKLLDFGIAKLTESSGTDRGITNTNEAMGTLAYMSPEQALGDRVDLRTDIYALGIVIYQVVTGEVPFDGTSQFQVMEKHVRAAPPRLRDLLPSAPAELEAAVLRCMAKEPSARFPSVEALAAVLDRVVGGDGPLPIASRPPVARVDAPVPAQASGLPEKTVFEPIFEIGEGGGLQPEAGPVAAGLPDPTQRLDNHRLRAQRDDATQSLPEPRIAEPALVERLERPPLGDVAPSEADARPPRRERAGEPRASAASEDFTITGTSGPSRSQSVVRIVAGGLIAMLAGGGLALWLTADAKDESDDDTAAVAAAAVRKPVVPEGPTEQPSQEAEPSGLVIGEPPEDPVAAVEVESGNEAPSDLVEEAMPEPVATKSASGKANTKPAKQPDAQSAEASNPPLPDPFEAGPGPTPKPSPAPRATKPKGDDALIRAAKRKALKRCGGQVKGAVASFQIMSSGSIVLAKVAPANTCAQAIVKAIDFPPRDKPVKKSFTF